MKICLKNRIKIESQPKINSLHFLFISNVRYSILDKKKPQPSISQGLRNIVQNL